MCSNFILHLVVYSLYYYCYCNSNTTYSYSHVISPHVTKLLLSICFQVYGCNGMWYVNTGLAPHASLRIKTIGTTNPGTFQFFASVEIVEPSLSKSS